MLGQDEQLDLNQALESSLQNYRTNRLIKAIQLSFYIALNDAFELLTADNQRILPIEILDIVVPIYKIFKCIYDRRRKYSLYYLWRHKQQTKINEYLIARNRNNQALLFKMQRKQQSYFIWYKSMLSMAFEKLKSNTQPCITQYTTKFKQLALRKLFNQIQSHNSIKLREVINIIFSQKDLDIKKLIHNKMFVIIKRQLTKLYIKNAVKQDFQIKYQTMGKLLNYLNQDRNNDAKKMNIFNKYISNRYYLMSYAFAKIKNQKKTNLNSYQRLQTVKKINTKIFKILEIKQKVGFKKISIVLKKYLNQSFSHFKRSIKIKRQKIQSYQPEQLNPHVDSDIFANCLNQYLFLMGHIPPETQAVRRKSTTIFKLIFKRKYLNILHSVRNSFNRLKSLIPYYSYQQRLSILKTINQLQTQKQQLINRLSN